MKDALEYIVKQIVENADEVSIDEQDIDGVITFTVHVAKVDMGRLIGKNGKIIRSLRNIMKIPAIKEHKKVQVQLSEE